MLFQKRVVRTKLDIYVFNSAHGTFLEDITLIRYVHLLESQKEMYAEMELWTDVLNATG